MNIDADKSYEVFDPSTNNHNIFVHLIKQEKVKCDLCNTLDKHISKGTKKFEILYSTEDNLSVKTVVSIFKNTVHLLIKINQYLLIQK